MLTPRIRPTLPGIMTTLPKELEAADGDRRFGTGWISGVLALVLATLGLGAVLCLRYPEVLTVADARQYYNVGLIRIALHVVLVAGFILGIVSIVLRKQKVLGFSAMSIVLLATVLGGSRATDQIDVDSRLFLGLDWFLLNLLFTGIVFIPIERLLGRREQPIFRYEWREDLLYFLISSLFVQALTYISLAPSLAILKNTDWAGFRRAVGSQPVVLQFFEIMFLTDLVQYWVHRAFHRVPWLWNFHAVHHSAETMDWLASSRMHLMEVVVLRGLTVIPMYVLGFTEAALYAYLIFVYLLSAAVHSNVRINFGFLEPLFVTPRFHHWHHGIEHEAIDVNFAVHFPLFDKLFGTYHLPADGRWPDGYGIQKKLPKGFLRQFLHPFRPRHKASDSELSD
jgi:sterol desaturase/sphingolipid hydroxylase (fatty acid hydroxylase superfamily)